VKAKFAYLLLILGILALLTAGAVMSRTLFDMSISGTEVDRLQKPPAPCRSPRARIAVAEKIIDVGAPEPIPAAAPTAPAPVPGRPAPVASAAQAPTPAVMPATAAAQRPAAPTRAPAPVITRGGAEPKAAAVVEDAEAAGVGRIVSIRGTVYATDTRGNRRVLALESWIFAHDRVDTDKGARITIRFRDGSTLSQGESTTVVVDEYVYDGRTCDNSCFAVRFIRGVCRIITGAIAEVNPNRFEVKTRMATVGIRGCDLAFRSSLDRDDIYVIDLAGKKLVRVNTTADGSSMVNVLTGKDLEVDNQKKTVIDITEPNSAIFVTRGKGVTRGTITLEDVREIAAETSLLSPARSRLIQGPDGAVFEVRPCGVSRPQAPDQAK